MPYDSVDVLQRALTESVFHYAKDAKKAAGRALGTLVEIVTFYLLKAWGFEKHTAIERRLPEYGNPEITHNVEFSLHPSCSLATLSLSRSELPITARKIAALMEKSAWPCSQIKSTQLISSGKILRNACALCEGDKGMIVAHLGAVSRKAYRVHVHQFSSHPFAVLECKRVGVEEGVKKGPQTIEKAKQGAYVARAISSLQKIRMSDGSVYGVLELDDGRLRHEPYVQFVQEIVGSDDPALLRNFILTVGIVSNHGNWFTSEDHNKELKVLAQSYDWLLFLSDAGLSEFVERLLLDPEPRYRPVKRAFAESYTGKRGRNVFTKVRIALGAGLALEQFFASSLYAVEEWFNVISPAGRSMAELRHEISLLAARNWKEILR